MRLVSYLAPGSPAGPPSVGVVVQDGIVDCSDLLRASDGGIRGWLGSARLEELASIVDQRAPLHELGSVRLLPPVSDPAKIICVGLNYRSHLLETGRPFPEHPMLFARWADTQMGHASPAVLPAATTSFDYEGELAVIIGAHARDVGAAGAWDVIAGYSVYNDFSARDWQRHTSQFLPGKNFPATGGFGPWLVTRDEVDDIGASVLTTRVNGEIRQQAPISDLLFDIPHLVAYVSTFTPLAPGDVIVTGTPGGVGLYRDPPAFLVDGDQVSVDITGIGELVNPIRAAAS